VHGYKKGKAHIAAFSPDGKYILTGQHNGQVALHFHNSLTQRPPRTVLTEHPKPVRGIHFMERHPIVVTAGAEGQIRFLRWPEMQPLGTIHSPTESGEQLTSLHISRNGSFMATGTNEASLRLWDLRMLDIPGLFEQPIAKANHEQIATLIALGEYQSIPEPVRNGLKFLRLLLQYRFRYDIQIEEVATIQYGEFDIFLDDSSREVEGKLPSDSI
jgi:WD40 repeat protein